MPIPPREAGGRNLKYLKKSRQRYCFARSAVSQMMKEHSVRLYDLAEVGPLVEDIRKNAQIHRTN
jgi:hypothetical protein